MNLIWLRLLSGIVPVSDGRESRYTGSLPTAAAGSGACHSASLSASESHPTAYQTGHTAAQGGHRHAVGRLGVAQASGNRDTDRLMPLSAGGPGRRTRTRTRTHGRGRKRGLGVRVRRSLTGDRVTVTAPAPGHGPAAAT